MVEGLWDTVTGAFTISAFVSAKGSTEGSSSDASTASLSTSAIGERGGFLSMSCFSLLFLRRVRGCDILAGLNTSCGGDSWCVGSTESGAETRCILLYASAFSLALSGETLRSRCCFSSGDRINKGFLRPWARRDEWPGKANQQHAPLHPAVGAEMTSPSKSIPTELRWLRQLLPQCSLQRPRQGGYVTLSVVR